MAARTDALAHAHRVCAARGVAGETFRAALVGAVYFHPARRSVGSGAGVLHRAAVRFGKGGAAGGLALRFLPAEHSAFRLSFSRSLGGATLYH